MGKKRYYSLDLLKFILAIIIIFHHFQQSFEITFPNYNFYFGKIYFGYVVEFFFIISGFVSAIGISDVLNKGFKQYFLNKCIRIYPMVILSVLFLVLIGLLENTYYNLWYILISMSTLFRGECVADFESALNYPTWYLGVLICCYIILYLILWISKRLEIDFIYGCVAMIMLGLGAMSYSLSYPFFNPSVGRGYSTFFLGIILYRIYKKNNINQLAILSIITIIICGLAYIVDYDAYYADLRNTCTYIIYPSVLFLMLWINKFFKNKTGGNFGGMAFEMYIWHTPLFSIIHRIDDNFSISSVYPREMMLCVGIIMCIWGYFIYKYLEIPITKKLKELISL